MGIFMIFKLNAIINSDGFQHCFDEMWKGFHFLLLHVVNPILSQYRQWFLHKRQNIHGSFWMYLFPTPESRKLNNFKSQKWMRGSYSHNYSYFFFKKVWSVSFNKSEMQRDEKMKQKYCFVTDTKSISVKKKMQPLCFSFIKRISNGLCSPYFMLHKAPLFDTTWKKTISKISTNTENQLCLLTLAVEVWL